MKWPRAVTTGILCWADGLQTSHCVSRAAQIHVADLMCAGKAILVDLTEQSALCETVAQRNDRVEVTPARCYQRPPIGCDARPPIRFLLQGVW